MAASKGKDDESSFKSFSDAMAEFSKAFDYPTDISKNDIDENIEKVGKWIDENQNKTAVKELNKVITNTVTGLEKFTSGDPFEISSGILDIITSVATLVGGTAFGAAAASLQSVIEAILSANRPTQPSVMQQMAKVMHNEMVKFNRKLLSEKFNGLSDRIQRQLSHLKNMKSGDALSQEMAELWKDCTQFLGELSDGFESPLPFKYEEQERLTQDPDMEDFETALLTYCHAYACLIALLVVTRLTFERLGGTEGKERMLEAIDGEIEIQRIAAKGKLHFLSDQRYLTFLGRLPSEGGKLTKIVILSRNTKGKRLVESLTDKLELDKMPDPSVVEAAAAKVARQMVKLKVPKQQIRRAQFVNQTRFHMKIVSGTVSWPKANLTFVQNVQPGSVYSRQTNPRSCSFSTGGYIIIYKSGTEPNTDKLPNGDADRVIEFALSSPLMGIAKVNIQDKTDSEFTKGWDTYKQMQDAERKTVYWKNDEEHYVAVGELLRPDGFSHMCRFVIQQFDPINDVVEEDT